jgi:hypothetical protein
MTKRTVTVACLALIIVGCATTKRHADRIDLLAPETISKWMLTPQYETRKPWVLEDGAFRGFDSWVGHKDAFGDFVLKCDFLYSGKGQGGIVIRGDRKSPEPWKDGYELDIHCPDGNPTNGHIHFPVRPRPYGGNALFELGKWHAVRIVAKGPSVVVFLDDKEVLAFEDQEFHQGSICLEGDTPGVKYRNLTVSSLED